MNLEDIAGLLILLANLAILGINLKVYTEQVKDKNIDKRVKQQYEPKA